MESHERIVSYAEGLMRIAGFVGVHPEFYDGQFYGDAYRVHCNTAERFDLLVDIMSRNGEVTREDVGEFSFVSRDFGGARLVVQKYTAAVAA